MMQDPMLEEHLQMQLDAELGAAVRQLPDGVGLLHYEEAVAGRRDGKWLVTAIGWDEVYCSPHVRMDTPDAAITAAFEWKDSDGSG